MGQEEGGLDIKKLRNMQKDLNKKAGDGDGIYLFANKLPEELDVRLLPPPAILNGAYFVEQEVWWINGKIYLSNSTEVLGGGVDVIQEEVDAARATKDPDLIALLDKKNDKKAPVVKKEFKYLTALLVLKSEYDDDDVLIKCDVVDTKVLDSKISLIKAINSVVTARPFQNQTKYGLMDRVKGFNIILGKSGTGLDTKYAAMGWTNPMEMPEEYYDEKKIPNVYEITQKAAKSDEYLRSVIRNYLYGEPILEDEKQNASGASDTKDEAKADKPKATAPVTKRASLANATPVSDNDEEEEEEKPKTAPVTAAKSATKGRSLLEDAENDLSNID